MRLMSMVATVPVGTPGHWRPHFLDLKDARRLEGAISVRAQLEWVARCNSALAALDVSALLEPANRGLAAAVAIGYRQCFNSGSRKFRLTDKHIKRCSSHSRELHSQIMAVATKAIAHAESWLDEVGVGMYLNQHGEFRGLAMQHLRAAALRKDEHERLVRALAELRGVVDEDIETLNKKCVAHVNALSTQQRLAASEMFISPPAAPRDGIKP